jgi:hypothetical protein
MMTEDHLISGIFHLFCLHKLVVRNRAVAAHRYLATVCPSRDSPLARARHPSCFELGGGRPELSGSVLEEAAGRRPGGGAHGSGSCNLAGPRLLASSRRQTESSGKTVAEAALMSTQSALLTLPGTQPCFNVIKVRLITHSSEAWLHSPTTAER